MADFSGIEAVTSTLRQILLQRSQLQPQVTAAPPDLDVPNIDPPVVNLFLYRISESGGLRNQPLPPSTGTAALAPPPLALDAHYLLTATGLSETDDLGAHRVLGDAMVTLSDHPIIPKDDPLLEPSLRTEVELLKITLDTLDTEELSKIWTATTAPYRLAVGYRVTVLQLESTRSPRVVRQVLEPPAGPRVAVLPLDRPVIDRIAAIRSLPGDDTGREQPVAHVRIGDRLVVHGHRLHPGTRVLLDDVDATASVEAETSTPHRLVVTVPDDPALQPGVHGIQIVRDATIGQPPDDRRVPMARSGLGAFVLVPTIAAIVPAEGADPTTAVISGRRLVVADGPPTRVLVGDRVLAPEADPDPTELQVAVTGVAAGEHRVSVLVAGTESIDAITFEVTS